MSANPTAAKTQTLHLAPTMLIGLGGTGKDVLLRIRRLFYDRGGKQDGVLGYPIIGYLALDTDPGAFSRIEGESLSNFVLQKIQFKRSDGEEVIDCSLNPDQFSQYFTGGQRQHPHVFRWLLPDMNKYGSSAVVEGAGQNRPLGRLAFFHHYRAIRGALELHLREIIGLAKDPNKLRSLPANVEVDATRLEVILVYSLAGGTGAGMFLDMGMLARIAVSELNLPDVRPHFTHFAVLPEPFVQAPRPKQRTVVEHERLQKKIQENAFTALREMEYFSMRQSEARFDLSIPPPANREGEALAPPLYRVQWEHRNAGGKEYAVHDCPWDTCYLIGGKNGAIAPNCLPVPEVYQMIAEHIFLDFDPGDFGLKKRSLRSNLHEQTLASLKDSVKDEDGGELYHRYMSRRFSTFGLSQIYYDRERMRRAASYRLAWRLVHDWWLRAPAASAGELHARAGEDLEGGAGGDGRVVTNTHLPNDRALPLSYDSVCRQVCLAEGGEDKTWWDVAREEAGQKRREVEDGHIDPLQGQAVLEAWQRGHLTRLKRTNAQAGAEGLALRNFDYHHHRIAPDVEGRLLALFLFRTRDLGVPGALQLFKEYAKRVEVNIHEADGVAANPPQEPQEWKQRLREAQQLPLFGRRAARWELLRAVGAIYEYVAFRYQHAAAEIIKASLDLAHQRVSATATEGSYAAALTRFRNQLEDDARGGTLSYLQARFDELRQPDKSRSRTVALLADYDEAEYNRQIERLLAPSTRPGAPPDWPRIESLVLEKLRQAADGGKQWRDVKDLGQLVLALFDIRNPQPLPTPVAEDFARRLAEACEALLAGFGGESSALKQFEREKAESRARELEKVRKFSSPYLCRSAIVGMDAVLDTSPTVYLGIAETNTTDEERRRFREALQDVVAGSSDHLHNLQFFTMKDDAVVLYQEKAGIPLCYDAGLVRLGELYDQSERKKETSLDYEWLKDRLPEIRLVDQDQQKLLAFCLQNALLGIMTGVLSYDPQGHRFRLPMRQAGGGSLTFAVGSRLEEVTHHCAQSRDVRRELEDQVKGWMDNASRNNPELLVGLWCAIQQMHEEIQRRVQALIDQEQGGFRPSTEAHPLLSILAKRMAPFVRTRLEGVPRERLSHLFEGAHWSQSALNWQAVASQAEGLGPEARAHAWEQWKKQFEECFRVINEDEMPIPVLLPNARLRPAPPANAAAGGPKS